MQLILIRVNLETLRIKDKRKSDTAKSGRMDDLEIRWIG